MAYKVKNGAKHVAPGWLSASECERHKQIVRLAGHSASPHSTALVLNVSLSTAWFWTYVDLKAILRASCFEQETYDAPDMENPR